jgi:hypothetical protein
MARTTDQPSASPRPNVATAQPDTIGSGPFDGQDQHGEAGRLSGNAERRGSLTTVRNKPNNDRDGERGNVDRRDDRVLGANRDGKNQHDGDTDRSARGEQPPVLPAGLDTFAPVLEAWKQVFRSWSELTETMVKAQQDAFADLIGAANTTAKALASSGPGTTASTPDRIEHDGR